MSFYIAGLFLFSIADKGWMVFAFLGGFGIGMCWANRTRCSGSGRGDSGGGGGGAAAGLAMVGVAAEAAVSYSR